MKKLLFALCLPLISYTSFANEWTAESFNWGELDKNSAGVFLKRGSDTSSEQVIIAEISHGKGGSQNIYISAEYLRKYNMCDVAKTSDNGVAKFNGKAVKVFVWCKKYDDDERYYLQLTPSTDAGHKYIVNVFKNSASYVSFEFNNMSATIPATGFTAAWNNAGGDAL